MSSSASLYACIDLGTNTFHLLIGRWLGSELDVHYRERHFVKIADEGIAEIGEQSVLRALSAVRSLAKSLKRFEVEQVSVYGTAALRTARNGEGLKKQIENVLEHHVSIIDGQMEAKLIAAGVLSSVLPKGEKLIMDIGGGSVEFILIDNKDKVQIRESYPIGAQVLKQNFHVDEPFVSESSQAQENSLFAHLKMSTDSLINAVGQKSISLIGASGTFDVLADLFGKPFSSAVYQVKPGIIRGLYKEARSMSHTVRLADKRLPTDRADMIVVALALIVFILDNFKVESCYTCEYALKEGAIRSMQNINEGS